MELQETEAHLHLPQSYCYVANTKARKRSKMGSQVASQAGDFLRRFPALWYPASLPHHVVALRFLTHRQQEGTCGFQAGEPVSESSGGKAGVKQSQLQPAATFDYSGSTSDEGLRGLYHEGSRILIEIQVATLASLERTWGSQFPNGELLSLYESSSSSQLWAQGYCKQNVFPSFSAQPYLIGDLKSGVSHQHRSYSTAPSFTSDFQLHWYNTLKICLLFGKINTAVW